MAEKYKAVIRKADAGKTAETQKEEPIIGRGKILVILVLGTLIAAGFYIAAMKMVLKPVFHIYWAITLVLLLAFLFMNKRREYLHEKAKYHGKLTAEEIDADRKRRKHIKYLLLVLLPFLFTVIGDTVYLLFLQDLKLFESLSAIFGK